MLAQLSSFWLNLSIAVFALRVRHTPMLLRCPQRRAGGLILTAMLFHGPVEAQKATLIQFAPRNLQCPFQHLPVRKLLATWVPGGKGHGLHQRSVPHGRE